MADSVTQSCAGQIVERGSQTTLHNPSVQQRHDRRLPDPFTGGEGCQPGAINNSRQIARVLRRKPQLLLDAVGKRYRQ